MFSAGLHFTFHDFIKAGPKSTIIRVFDVIIPRVVRYFITIWVGFEWTVAVIIGTTFSAISIAVSVVILEEIGKEKTKESNILVNAEVLDEVLGLAIHSAVISLIALHAITAIESVVVTAITEIGFWFYLVQFTFYQK